MQAAHLVTRLRDTGRLALDSPSPVRLAGHLFFLNPPQNICGGEVAGLGLCRMAPLSGQTWRWMAGGGRCPVCPWATPMRSCTPAGMASRSRCSPVTRSEPVILASEDADGSECARHLRHVCAALGCCVLVAAALSAPVTRLDHCQAQDRSRGLGCSQQPLGDQHSPSAGCCSNSQNR